jgi:multicomponent K+:H+ antiporter subunit D
MAVEIAPVAALLVVLMVMSIKADAVLRYTQETSLLLYENKAYASGALASLPVTDIDPAPSSTRDRP